MHQDVPAQVVRHSHGPKRGLVLFDQLAAGIVASRSHGSLVTLSIQESVESGAGRPFRRPETRASLPRCFSLILPAYPALALPWWHSPRSKASHARSPHRSSHLVNCHLPGCRRGKQSCVSWFKQVVSCGSDFPVLCCFPPRL